MRARKRREDKIINKWRNSEQAQKERPLSYFRSFWTFIEGGPQKQEQIELDQIISQFADFWSKVVPSEETTDDKVKQSNN